MKPEPQFINLTVRKNISYLTFSYGSMFTRYVRKIEYWRNHIRNSHKWESLGFNHFVSFFGYYLMINLETKQIVKESELQRLLDRDIDYLSCLEYAGIK